MNKANKICATFLFLSLSLHLISTRFCVCDVAFCFYAFKCWYGTFIVVASKKFFVLLLRFEGVTICTHASFVPSPYIFSIKRIGQNYNSFPLYNCCSDSDWQAKNGKRKDDRGKLKKRKKKMSTSTHMVAIKIVTK